MNSKNKDKDSLWVQIAEGVGTVLGIMFDLLGGVLGGFAQVGGTLIGWGLGIAVFALLCFLGWNFLQSIDLSEISVSLQESIESVTEGGTIEGFIVEASTMKKIPAQDEIDQARRDYEADAEKYKERHDGDPYPFAFNEPKPRQVTTIQFKDGRVKEFSGVSPKPIPTQQYVVIKYNDWTNKISDVLPQGSEETQERKPIDAPRPDTANEEQNDSAEESDSGS